MPPAGFEHAIPASELPKAFAFDRSAAGICINIEVLRVIYLQ
jgi:hypothetical protein